MKPILHDYQRYAAEFIKHKLHPMLMLDMGLGKTLITLTALQEIAQQGQLSGHILVIAPKKIAVNTWPDEIEKWDHTKHVPFTVIAGKTKKQRKAIFDDIHNGTPAQFYMINREQTQEIVKEFKHSWPFPNVIIDEIQSFKNPTSARTLALKSVRHSIHRMIGLTGTPAPRSIMDLWAQISLLDGGYRLGPNITYFREVYFDPGRRTPQGQPYEYFLKPGAEQAIYSRISDMTISMKGIDHLKIPPITINDIVVTMTKPEKRIYNTLMKEHVLDLIDGSQISAANAGVLTANLSQLASGAIYKDKTKKEVIRLHDHKLEALSQIIDSMQGEPLLVFYWFKHDLMRIKEKFPDAVVFDDDPTIVKRWNNKEIPILLAQPSSTGHGLNLQDGGHTIVWFSLTWSLELYLQGNARVYRQGQTQPVVIHRIVTKSTIDDKMIKSVLTKNTNQDNILNAVKANVNSDEHALDLDILAEVFKEFEDET